MTQGKHTAGQLNISAKEPHNIISAHKDSPGLSIAMATRFVPMHRDKSVANAARLAQCWNACEGIADPSAIKDVVEAATGLASDVQCLIECRSDCGEWGAECPLQDAHKPDGTIERLQRLLDALAKLGGQS